MSTKSLLLHMFPPRPPPAGGTGSARTAADAAGTRRSRLGPTNSDTLDVQAGGPAAGLYTGGIIAGNQQPDRTAQDPSPNLPADALHRSPRQLPDAASRSSRGSLPLQDSGAGVGLATGSLPRQSHPATGFWRGNAIGQLFSPSPAALTSDAIESFASHRADS